jgi:hypothetical protein
MSADLREGVRRRESVVPGIARTARGFGRLVLVAGMVPVTVAGPPGPVDRAGDPLTPGAVARLGTTRFRHGSSIRQVAYTPDGKLLMSLGDDGVIRLRDAATGVEIRRLAEESPRISGFALAPGGRTLVTSSREDVVIRTWEVASGRRIHRGPDHGVAAQIVATSPDGLRLARGSRDGIALADATTGRLIRRIEGHPRGSDFLVFTPDGRLIAVAEAAVRTQDRQVSLWEVATGQEVRRLEGHLGVIRAIAFSPDGRLLATGADDRPRWRDQSLRIWDVANGRLSHRLDVHRSGVGALAFSPDGARLASAGEDGTALIWDVRALIPEALPSPSDRSPEPLVALWGTLRDDDAAAAESAAWALASRPEPATALLAERLRPVTPADPSRVAALIADLDSPRFSVRERASGELGRLGLRVEPALKAALRSRPTPEVRSRIERLLRKPGESVPSPELLRVRRAIGVLERIGNDEARRVLEGLAEGAPGMPETEQARAAARRLRLRSGALPQPTRRAGVVAPSPDQHLSRDVIDPTDPSRRVPGGMARVLGPHPGGDDASHSRDAAWARQAAAPPRPHLAP